jgi:hypothetical protein
MGPLLKTTPVSIDSESRWPFLSEDV